MYNIYIYIYNTRIQNGYKDLKIRGKYLYIQRTLKINILQGKHIATIS